MNERIDVIAKKAGLHTEWFIDNPEIEKFAELLIQECLKACSRSNEIRSFAPPTRQQVVLDCMREIENTFGVEK